MEQADLEKKLLAELGLDKLPEDDKKNILKKLDEALLNRFIANLLGSMPKESHPQLEKALEKAEKEGPDKFFEEAVKLHPDAEKVMKESAEQIIKEFKKNQPAENTGHNQHGQKTDNSQQPKEKMSDVPPQTANNKLLITNEPEYYQAG
jgi:hypothetical protein